MVSHPDNIFALKRRAKRVATKATISWAPFALFIDGHCAARPYASAALVMLNTATGELDH